MFNPTNSHRNLYLKFCSIFSHHIDKFRKENKLVLIKQGE